MRLFIDWGLLLFSALTRSRVAQSFLLSLRPSVLSSIFLPPSLCIGGHAVGLATLKATRAHAFSFRLHPGRMVD